MATNAAHTEVPGGHKVPFPPFNPQTFASQLVWLAITFVILYAAMAKLALPRIGAIIETRRKHVADDIAEAQRLKGEADAAIAAYEKALADARGRAQAIANEMRQQQMSEAEASRKKFEQALNAKLAEAETSIAATKQAAMANVSGIAAEAAAAIVARLIGTAPGEKAVAQAVADVLKR
jgi:F-type H+-transporting ATPase subunit b